MEFFDIDIDRLLESTIETDYVEVKIKEKFVEIDQLLEQTRNW